MIKDYISPKYDSSKIESGEINDLIDVLEDRVQNWLFEPVKEMLINPKGIMTGLGVIMTYFEGITIYMRGEDSIRRSAAFFEEGFIGTLLPSGHPERILSRVAKVVYEEARCGFAHDGFVRGKVLASYDFEHDLTVTVPRVNGKVDIDGEIQSIIINPRILLAAIERHFNEYIGMLRDDSANEDAREKFREACRIKWGLDGPPVVIGMDREDHP